MRYLEFAPAKLNLWLRIHNKRDDGFHEIETLIVPITTVKDDLHFDLNLGAGEITFECNDFSLESDRQNLVLQALRALQCEAGIELHGKIKLVKRIPVGAGLGGGSSDAAATLRAVNKILECPLSSMALNSLAASIAGAVFFASGSMRIGPGSMPKHCNCSVTIKRKSEFVSVTCCPNLTDPDEVRRIAVC